MQKLLVVILSYLSNILFAQSPINISGQIKDARTKEALEFCSIFTFNTKDSLIASSVTDQNGFFTVALYKGNYHFIIRIIGYKTDTTDLIAVTENNFLGVFKLEPDEKLLKEVTIKANTRENLLDREEQIVTSKLRTAASNAYDVLDKLNGVEFDRIDNTIKVNGKSKVMILVDGIEKDPGYVKNLSPERLQKIEIIRDPGGRYGLEGYSAVINIILKKDYQGTELFTSEEIAIKPDAVSNYIVSNNTSANLNYTYNKVNVYVKYNPIQSHFNVFNSGTKEYSNGLIVEKKVPDTKKGNYIIQQFSHNYTIGSDYYINPKQTISFESNLKTSPAHNNLTEEMYRVITIENGKIANNSNIESRNNSQNIVSYNSLFYVNKLNENNVLNFDFTYSYYEDNYINIYKENLLYESIEGKNKKNETKFHSEYNYSFNKTSIQLGYGNTWKKIRTNYSTEEQVSLFEFKDIRNNLFIYYSWQPNNKLGIKIGGAGELSLPETNAQHNNYFIFQPYADIKYKFSSAWDFKLKYRSGNNYPNISQTAPFAYFIDQQSIRTGNTYLKPEVVHKVSFQTGILNGLILIEPYYHFSRNYIAETGILRNDSIFEYSYDNIGEYTNYGTMVNIAIPLGKIFSLQLDVDFYKSNIYYVNKSNSIKDWPIKSTLMYTNQKRGMVIALKYCNWLHKQITAQGYNNNIASDYWAFFIQKSLFKNRLNISSAYIIPIMWGVDYMKENYIKTDTYQESIVSDVNVIKNWIMLTASFRFNAGKSIIKTEKNIEKEIEKNTKSVF